MAAYLFGNRPQSKCANRGAIARLIWVMEQQNKGRMNVQDRSHALRGNASCDALRRGRGVSWAALPRRAWECSVVTSR
ncbi:hypothetical protein D7M10_02060 [Pseudomonas fluorescens]|nr:hypothetical protein D7M10_02060 [Pseudomonas fluorescens]